MELSQLKWRKGLAKCSIPPFSVETPDECLTSLFPPVSAPTADHVIHSLIKEDKVRTSYESRKSRNIRKPTTTTSKIRGFRDGVPSSDLWIQQKRGQGSQRKTEKCGVIGSQACRERNSPVREQRMKFPCPRGTGKKASETNKTTQTTQERLPTQDRNKRCSFACLQATYF